jgi:hypothetical protein
VPPEKPSERLRQAFELAGAVAGVVFLVYLVGGLVTWQRFRTLGLADEASVAALPREGLLVAGLLALKSPLILGLLVLIFYVCLDEVWNVERKAAGNEKTRTARLGGVALIVVLIAAVIATRLYAGSGSMAIVAVGGAVAIAAARASSRRGIVAYGIFIAVAVTGAVGEDLAIRAPPTHLEPAAVFLDGMVEPVPGYFIAESSSFVYLAAPPLARCRVGHLVRAFRRQDIAELRLAPRIDVWPSDRTPKGKDLERCTTQQAKAEGLLARSP